MTKMNYCFALWTSMIFLLFSFDKASLINMGEDGSAFLIDSEQLYGRYEVTAGSLSILGMINGRVVQISPESIEIQCDNTLTYSRTYNTFSIDGKSFLVTEKAKGEEYQISYTTLTSRNYVTLTRTDKPCWEDDEEEGEEETTDPTTDGPLVGTVQLDKLYGYGIGTTGGEGASTEHIHHFDDGDKFRAWLNAREKAKSKVPAIVWLSGTFTKENGRDGNSSSPWFDIKDTDNLTIYGTNSFRMQNIGFFIVRSNNIIIRNVYILMPKADNGADAISMQNSSQIWIDHCTFESTNQTSDYEDGACDITHATTNVTVSWNHFIKTQKSSLVGHSNNNTVDAAIKATFHHNFFDQTSSRHPRVRFGQVHVFNNFIKGASTYGIGSAYEAKVLVEGNYFDGVHLPTDICTFPAKRSGNNWVSNLTGSVAGYLYASHNEYVNKPSNASDPYPFTNVEYKAYDGEKLSSALTREDFLPPYTYEIDIPAQVKDIVAAGAGVGKLSGYANAPISVDNGGIQDTGGGNPGNGNDPITLENGWIALAVGNSQLDANVGSSKNSITISGAGKFESGKQEFSYVYREITGYNFVVTVQLDDYPSTVSSNQSLAGIFLTPDPNADGTDLLHAMVAKGGTGNFHRSDRTSAGNASRGNLSPSSGSHLPILKLERNGNSLIRSVSLDGGATFGSGHTATIANLPEKVYIGLAVSSGNNNATTATFSDFKVDDTTVSF